MVTTEDERREAAIERLKAKREFKMHAAAYVIVNAGLILIWALSGAGYFWPIWPIGGWGIGLALNAWVVHVQKPITEDEIAVEINRHESPGAPQAR